MAMYYYASKLSAIACGTRCKQHQQQHQQHMTTTRTTGATNSGRTPAAIAATSPAPASTTTASATAASAEKSPDGDGLSGGVQRYHQHQHQQQQQGQRRSSARRTSPNAQMANNALEATVLGTGGIMYGGGNVMSGPQDSLVDLLMPSKTEDLDKEYIFSFLLSSRLFVRPHELLGRLLAAVPELEPLDRLVGLLGIWTNTFPYDFRDERIMCHVKHIVARCANTSLGDVVSELLSALLNRLTELEKHEKELRVCQTFVDETEIDKLPSATQLAQMLCRIERKMAKHIGPEEFVQCSASSRKSKKSDKSPTSTTASATTSTPTMANALDPKKTCNLESYLDWSARLRTLVANEVLLCNGIRDRSKSVELWSGVAQYCLLVGNYNSATAILESLESPAIARLQTTWSKLSSTSQQLDCMQRHADGCGDLWHKQTGSGNGTIGIGSHQQQRHFEAAAVDPADVSSSIMSASSTGTGIGIGSRTAKPPPLVLPPNGGNDWVVIPVFADIVRLAIHALDDCQTKLPNGHLNVAAFNRLAAIVGAFTKHMCDTVTNAVPQTSDVRDEYQNLCRRMQSCTLLTDNDLMLASFDCEQPSAAEKEAFNLA